MGLFNFKKKEEGSKEAAPVVPGDLNLPEMPLNSGLMDEPPKPNDASVVNSNEIPSIPDVPSFDDFSEEENSAPQLDSLPDLPDMSNHPESGLAKKSTVNSDLGDLSFDDFEDDLSFADDATLEEDSTLEEKTTLRAVEEDPEYTGSSSFEEPAVYEEFNPEGPIFLKVDTFREVLEDTSAIKSIVDDVVELSEVSLKNNASKLNDAFDSLQTALQTTKKKLYLVDEILFNR